MKKTIIASLLILMLGLFGACSKTNIGPSSTKGTISMVNNSTYAYKVYVNGSYEFKQSGGTYKDISVNAGSYSVRVEQAEGYVLYPTVQTYDVYVSAGGKQVISYP